MDAFYANLNVLFFQPEYKARPDMCELIEMAVSLLRAREVDIRRPPALADQLVVLRDGIGRRCRYLGEIRFVYLNYEGIYCVEAWQSSIATCPRDIAVYLCPELLDVL